jgi:hypothetical protein
VWRGRRGGSDPLRWGGGVPEFTAAARGLGVVTGLVSVVETVGSSLCWVGSGRGISNRLVW